MRKNSITRWDWIAATIVALTMLDGAQARDRADSAGASWETIRADFRNVRGLNYIASYAPSDVAMWRFYDRDQIDRELGYIRALGANSIRVWLAWVVYETEGERFIEKFSDFLSLCEKHRITVMPILWDSCFGDARASYEDVTDWVANPGTDRVADPGFRAEGDRYVRAVVQAGRDSPSLLVWDVMNEPSGAKINEWLEHYCRLVKSLDAEHPVTIGWAHAGSNKVSADWVDVMSYHPYGIFDKNRMVWTDAVRKIAREHGNKPILATEAGGPGFGQRYEECLAYFEREAVGFYLFEAMVGTNRFRDIAGFVFPDGSARELDAIRAFQACARRQGVRADTPFEKNVQKLPYSRSRAREIADLILNWDSFQLNSGNIVEYQSLLRWTFISLAWGGSLGEHLDEAQRLNAQAEAAQKNGDIETLKATLSKLARLAAELLVQHGFVAEDGTPVTYPREEETRLNGDTQVIDLPGLGSWKNPFSEHPLFRAVVDEWKVRAEGDDARQVLNVNATLKRSTDHPLTVGDDWTAELPVDELSLEAKNRSPREVKVGVVLVDKSGQRIPSPFHAAALESKLFGWSVFDGSTTVFGSLK